MTLAEKLRFLADRAEDGKEFYATIDGNKLDWKLLPLMTRHRLDDLYSMELEIKPKWEFTEDEKAILRNVNSKYEFIARNETNRLGVYESKPIKRKEFGYWGGDGYCYITPFNHLFQSVQWEDDEPCEFRRYL